MVFARPHLTAALRAVCPVMFAGLALLGVGCDSPTEPQRAQSDAVTVAEATTVSISFDPANPPAVEVGMELGFSVTVSSDESPAPTQVGVSTSLGSFRFASGKTGTTGVVPLSGGRASFTFVAGNDAGNATIAANVGNETVSVGVNVTEAPSLFLQSIDPVAGPPNGGFTATIAGTGFREGLRVTFGGTNAEIMDVSSSQVTVEVPPSTDPVAVGSTRTVEVVVTVPPQGDEAAMSDTLTGGFTYAHGTPPEGGAPPPRPAILSVSPAGGPNRGSIPAAPFPVTINGSGFESNVTVSFGTGSSSASFMGIAAGIRSSSSTQIVVDLPAAPPSRLNQTVGILVRNNSSGLTALAANVFTYGEQEVITDIQPREALYTGTNPDGSPVMVTITAQGVDAQDRFSVEFGGTFQATGCSSTNTTCTVADGSITLSSIQSVTVSGCNPPSGAVMTTDLLTGETATGPVFSYTADEPTITSVSPSSVTVDADGNAPAGTTATITGTFSELEKPNTLVLWNGQRVDTTIDAAAGTITVNPIPAFTNFDESACGTNGMRFEPAQIDVEVLYTSTGCNFVSQGAFTYLPADGSCREAANAPVAGFAFSIDDQTVTFTDQSSGSPDRWDWTFGDGRTRTIQTSDGVENGDTTHLYQEAGTYTVNLTVSNSGGSDSLSQNLTVGPASPPVASFNFSQVNDQTIQFVNTSDGDPDTLNWIFGDGASQTVDRRMAASPDTITHMYTDAGTFNVTLQATNAAGTDSFTQPVEVGPMPPVAGFGFNVLSGQRVQFIDQSSGMVDNYQWFFGDGDTSTDKDPIHQYPAAGGTFTVTQRVTNAAGSDEFAQDVTVLPDAPQAVITVVSQSGLTVVFRDDSIGFVESRLWDHGDGTTSTAASSSRTYAAPGTYTVTLQVENAAGIDLVSITVTVP